MTLVILRRTSIFGTPLALGTLAGYARAAVLRWPRRLLRRRRQAWASHVDMVERLASLAETIASTGGPMTRSRRSTRAAGGSLTERVAERVARLADDARVRAYEILGDRPRAVEIMERRLLAD
jgi:hypothetical protein